MAGLIMACGWLGVARCEEIAEVAPGTVCHQTVWSILALTVMFAVAVPNYRLASRWSYAGFVTMLLLLTAVYFFAPVNGAHRWIRAGGVGFQPSEFAKIAFVVALARYLAYRDTGRQFSGLVAPLAMTLVPLWLILKEPDLGTSLVFVPVLLAMTLAAGARLPHLVAIILLGVATIPALWSQMSGDQRSRVTALWEQNLPRQSPTPAGYHLHQAKRMFALGGWRGSAIETDVDDAAIDRRVPEPHTDSIFSVLGERYGIIGCGIVLLLYFLLVWRGLAIAQETREAFGRLLVVGVMAMIAFQAAVNTGMLAGLFPITGLPLPLISYGGSGLIANALGLGLVVNVGSRPGYQ
ncbi:MAG TPA: FtsW/RodA/SpoVE family cell cycle protein [Pirellulales bacterium]|nr:FtsW/RodA/SpoVE family cell cycle protein [Pirellulales bacterium]